MLPMLRAINNLTLSKPSKKRKKTPSEGALVALLN
jgi:hypothetical protein